MIKYALKCANGHQYEGWFGSSADYDEQAETGKLLCAVCGTSDIGKALMAPQVSTPGKSGGKSDGGSPQQSGHATQADQPDTGAVAGGSAPEGASESLSVSGPEAEKLKQAIKEMKAEVEKSCDWVGDRFADEARAMHYGDKEARGIYGKATPKEAKELKDEGVEVAPLPFIADPDDVN
ncbi:MAG: DUF1178 family protein [Alphaproteobacteria bacterium]